MKPGSKYEPLYQHLRRSGKDQLTLTFAEIERLVSGSLPDSASERGWWSNRANALQASAWMEAGYHVEELDMTKKRVTFRKPKTTYSVQRDDSGLVLWDTELIKGLRQHMGLTQAQFAEVLGVRQQTVSEWEVGLYAPTRATAKHLALVAERAQFPYHAET
ncbi:MAG: helix-turn-helix transcriptional regulator [Anaerolineales bacterium]